MIKSRALGTAHKLMYIGKIFVSFYPETIRHIEGVEVEAGVSYC